MTSIASDIPHSHSYTNTSTRIYVLILGILTGLGGALHGVFETLHGNKPTEGFVLAGIGAVTVIPNYLLTGIAAITVGISIIVWTIGYIHKNHGPVIFLLLSILLFLVGGGVAHVLGFIITWAVATRINKPLAWWERNLPTGLRRLLSGLWLPVLVTGFSLFAVGFGIWLFVLPPGEVREISTMQYVCWACLLLGISFLLTAIACGFARDIEMRLR